MMIPILTPNNNNNSGDDNNQYNTIIVIIFTLNKTKFFSKRVMFIIWISSFVGADSQVS